MMERTRIINGRKCVMVPGIRKSNSEEEAIKYASEELKLEDFEVARTGVSTWRVYNPIEPKVEKPVSEKKKEKKAVEKAVEKAEKAIVKAEKAIGEIAEATGVAEEKEAEAESESGSEGSETTPQQIEVVESHNVVIPGATDITEFGKNIIKALRNCLDPLDPDFSDVGAGNIAEKLGKKVNSVTGALKTLVERNYVTTLIDEENGKRVSVICLTQKGWKATL